MNILNVLSSLHWNWKNRNHRSIVKLDYSNSNTNKQIQPVVHLSLENPIPGHFYTLFMVDPDAPSSKNPIYADYVHWIKKNMILRETTLIQGEDIVPYKGPSPPPGSGTHRYIMIIYEHSQPIDFSGEIDRPSQKTKELIQRILGNNATPIGFTSFTFTK